MVLRDAISDAFGTITSAEVAIKYGKLLEAFLDFFIVGFTLFVVVKFMNRLKRKAHDTKDDTLETPKNIELLSKLNTLMEEQNAILKSSER